MRHIFTKISQTKRKWNFHVTPLALLLFVQPLQAQNTNSFCVLELFTSEGCSSCPSGDNMLNTVVNSTDNNTTNNLFIALHVELWNYLGWNDPYSNSQYDDMFFGYYNNGNGISFANGSQFGTPLFVRNGQEGRNYSTATQTKQATAWVDLSFNELSGNQLKVNYALTGDLTNTEVRFFLVERGLVNYVSSGENAGSTLHHENVARDMEILPTTNVNGIVTFTVPSNADLEKMRVMAYIRKTNSSPWSREIVGANKGFKVGDYVGLDELEESVEIGMFPNPMNSFTTILSAENMIQIDVVNEIGGIVYTSTPNSNQTSIDLTSCNNGIYFVKVVTDKGTVTKKLVKM